MRPQSTKMWDTKLGFCLDMAFHILMAATFTCLALGLGSVAGPSA